MHPCQGCTHRFGADSLRFQGDSDALSEREMGLEPTTCTLARYHSTAELLPQAADPVARLLDQATKLRQQADELERLALLLAPTRGRDDSNGVGTY